MTLYNVKLPCSRYPVCLLKVYTYDHVLSKLCSLIKITDFYLLCSVLCFVRFCALHKKLTSDAHFNISPKHMDKRTTKRHYRAFISFISNQNSNFCAHRSMLHDMPQIFDLRLLQIPCENWIFQPSTIIRIENKNYPTMFFTYDLIRGQWGPAQKRLWFQCGTT